MLLCCLLAGPAFSLTAAEQAAVLGRIVAAPSAQVNDVALPGDATLLDGDRLSTGPTGWARVFLPHGEQIHLGAQSHAWMQRLGGRLEVVLQQGQVTLRTNGRNQVTVFCNGVEIIPTGGEAVWEVRRLRDCLTEVSAQQGSLAVRAALGRTLEVRPGRTVRIQTQGDRPKPKGVGVRLECEQRPGVILLVVLGGAAPAIAIPLSLEDDDDDDDVVSRSRP